MMRLLQVMVLATNAVLACDGAEPTGYSSVGSTASAKGSTGTVVLVPKEDRRTAPHTTAPSTQYTTGLSATISGVVCDVTDHGAVGDNATLSTLSIQRAINHCAASYPHGSTVVVPRGNFRTGSLSLRSNMRFHLDEGAGLYGSTNPRDYHISQQWFGMVLDFELNFALEDAVGSHTCSLEVSKRVTNRIPLGWCPLLLTARTFYDVTTLKAATTRTTSTASSLA
jgi:hypothetical protein